MFCLSLFLVSVNLTLLGVEEILDMKARRVLSARVFSIK